MLELVWLKCRWHFRHGGGSLHCCEWDRAAKLRAVKRRRQQLKMVLFAGDVLSDKREGGSAAAAESNFTLFYPLGGQIEG